jgi:glycosyltransferase involved in cell wall biosynthesis
VAVLEALRFGVAVIDSVHDGNVGDLIRHEQTGLVFDPRVPGDLESAMEEAVREPTAMRRLARRGSALMDEQTPLSAAVELCGTIRAVRGSGADVGIRGEE